MPNRLHRSLSLDRDPYGIELEEAEARQHERDSLARLVISHGEFRNQLAAARLLDQERWRELNIERWLWEHFQFSDESVEWRER